MSPSTKNNRIADGWGEELQDWLTHGSYRDFAHLFRLRMAEKRESFHSLLDVGCGTGSLLRYCCDRGILCMGIDMSMTIVKYHKETTGLPVIPGDVMSIPVKDSRFDLVVCFGLIEHVPDPAAALRELRRVTSPNGRILISVPLRWGIFPLLVPVWYFTAGRYQHGWREMVGRMYSRRTLGTLLESNGWVVEEITAFKASSLLDWLHIPFSEALAGWWESLPVTRRLFGIMLYAIGRRREV